MFEMCYSLFPQNDFLSKRTMALPSHMIVCHQFQFSPNEENYRLRSFRADKGGEGGFGFLPLKFCFEKYPTT